LAYIADAILRVNVMDVQITSHLAVSQSVHLHVDTILGHLSKSAKEQECNGTVHNLFKRFNKGYGLIRREYYTAFSLNLKDP
jgi:hypothetical protein